MAADPEGRPVRGGDTQAEAACVPPPSIDGPSAGDDLLAGPCSCLPLAVDDWPACASCGLPQKPGKAFCSFCGRRWVTEGADADPSTSAADRPAVAR